MKYIYAIIVLSFLSAAAFGQTASSYTFSQSTTTYSTISGTTIFSTWDDNTISGLPIGFTFNYCGTNYTTFALNANGYIGFGTVSYGYQALTSGVKVIAGFSNDLYYNGPGHGPLIYSTTGSAPNRVLTIQWNNCCHFSSSSTGPLNFQIKLYESSNIVQIVYGNFAPTISSTYTTNQVGIKGNTSSDYNTRTTTSNWSATSAGTNSSYMWQSNIIKPSNGLTFTWCPPVPAISGASFVCTGDTLHFTDLASGGTWSSSNTGVATVSAGGVVTGISGGAATITYNPACGTFVTKAVTVNPAPASISGASTVCAGQTTTLTDATSGGTWTSSNPSAGTVSTGGVVTGISAAVMTISYTGPSGCVTTKPMTVNAAPTPIAGPSSVCEGGSITLTSSGGGTWSSSNPSLATIGSSSGIVSGVATGTPSIAYTFSNGCAVAQDVTVNPQPGAISGSGTVCASQDVILSVSPSGGTWSSSNPSVGSMLPFSGTVSGISAGSTTITYTLPTGCFSTATLSVHPFSAITGIPSMCIGYGTTLSDATSGGSWSSSNPAVATVSGTGDVSSVSLGFTTISYSIASSGCTATVPVAVTNSPSSFAMTGGGAFCTGGSGVSVELAGSDAGVVYQLYNYSTPVGAPLIGTGFYLNFGPQTSDGIYGVVADPGTGCATTMSGTAIVNAEPLPAAYTVSGGGNYCAGGTGAHVYLNSSAIGINYQLYNGTTPVAAPIPGTTAALDFGLQTATGAYTIKGTNTTTGCMSFMADSVTIGTTPLPATFGVTGGGGYCIGGSGVPVGLAASAAGVRYQLYRGGTITGAPVDGTGAPVSFGIQTTAGAYTVQATDTLTGCTANMTGLAVVSVNPLPTTFTVAGGGAYCSGGTGVSIGLTGSQSGVSYQLYRGGSTLGSPVAGTGAPLSFGTAFAVAGSYTVVATNLSTTCINNMDGSVTVSVNPLPSPFSVSGGGSYCSGGAGRDITLSGSQPGVNYQLLTGGAIVDAASGSGTSIDFGFKTAAGLYTVSATNPSTGCTATMPGSANIVINPLPTATYLVTGGGAYCAGGVGTAIGLSSSQSGISYRLLNGTTPTGSAVTGTGSSISFGSVTGAGSYTVVGTNTGTTCVNTMAGSVTVSINPTPTVHNVTGGGGFCTGGFGVPVGLSGSNYGVSYQLLKDGVPSGTAVTGFGFPLNFGFHSTIGTYTVIANNIATGCSSNMAGSAVVTENVLPDVQTVTGGGGYCSGGTGVHIGLAGSATGINYKLHHGFFDIEPPVAGTGAPVDFGAKTDPGFYWAVAINASTGCQRILSGSASVAVNPLPPAYPITGGGSYCSGGSGRAIGLAASTAGVSYQLYQSGVAVGSPLTGTGSVLDFGPQTGAGVYNVVATNTMTCARNMTGSATIATLPLPASFAVTGGGNYCLGDPGRTVGLASSEAGMAYQLFRNGTVVGAPDTGTGGAISFGLRTDTGTYTIVAVNNTTTCSSPMSGSAPVHISALPAIHVVTGGGAYCPGGTGRPLGLDVSEAGTSYQLYFGGVAIDTAIMGTGSTIDFGLHTATGTYSVIGSNGSTTCSATMAGAASISLAPTPMVYDVTGGGGFCPGGTGVHVGLSASETGITYQLVRGGLLTGSPVPGSGSGIDFGAQTTPGIYTVVATNTSNTCTNNMASNAVVQLNAVPAVHTVTGGGSYCTGTTGVHIGLDGSSTGIAYTLYRSPAIPGATVVGTGSFVDFGVQSAIGDYYVMATDPATLCSDSMAGISSVNLYPLPAPFNVTGGGNICAGDPGMHILLDGSETGITYQLFKSGTPVGAAVPGTGAGLDFGLQATGGSYTVVATSASMCTRSMPGSALISVNALPVSFAVTGGGSYCTGGSGVHVGLAGTATGTQYQLWRDGIAVSSSFAGTGAPIDFGLQTTTGNYMVLATKASTGCASAMSGVATVALNPQPTVYTIAGSGTSYCQGGAGIDISLAHSDLGFTYQLYNGTVPVGSPVPGVESAIDFGNQTTAGTYHVAAVNNVTGCAGNMGGTAEVHVNALPVKFTVTGGGAYCSGSSGVHVNLSGSNAGIEYSLYLGGVPEGTTIAGTGSSIDFGLKTASGAYSVVASNAVTGCSNLMNGSAAVTTNTPPASYNVSGGGSYCAGGGGVHIGLDGSGSGINYTLRRGSVIETVVVGTGGSLDFGLRALPGTYTVQGLDLTTGCSSAMPGDATVVVNSLPAPFAITGGGGFCPGGTGVTVGLSNSATGVTYQLLRDGAAVGVPTAGTGAALDFGLQNLPGAYSIKASNDGTGCINTMAGVAAVNLNPIPADYPVIGGGSFCSGGAGVHVGLSNSTPGNYYQLYNGLDPAGSAVTGTGGPLDFGVQTLAGTYMVSAVDPATTCVRNLTASVAVSVLPSVTPTVSITSTGGDTSCTGILVSLHAVTANAGSSPAYLWSINGVPVSSSASYSYIPLDGDVVSLSLTSNAQCALPAVVNTARSLTVQTEVNPLVEVTALPGTVVCTGTSVTLTAMPHNGGSAPVYSWIKAGNNVGTAATYTFTPDNGDEIYCVLTSNYHCRLANSATSNHIVFEVDNPTPPVVNIAATPGLHVAAGQYVNFTALVTNGGPLPSYQWAVNGLPIAGATNQSFGGSSFSEGDVVTCDAYSSGGCDGILGSGSVTMHISNVGVGQVQANDDELVLAPNPNYGTFTLAGKIEITGENCMVEIADMLGKIVYRQNLHPVNGVISEHIDAGSNLPAGQYLLHLHSGAVSKVFHFVIN